MDRDWVFGPASALPAAAPFANLPPGVLRHPPEAVASVELRGTRSASAAARFRPCDSEMRSARLSTVGGKPFPKSPMRLTSRFAFGRQRPLNRMHPRRKPQVCVVFACEIAIGSYQPQQALTANAHGCEVPLYEAFLPVPKTPCASLKHA